jgi:hypothetical protein
MVQILDMLDKRCPHKGLFVVISSSYLATIVGYCELDYGTPVYYNILKIVGLS